MFRSNVSSKFLYFVGKVFDENTGKVSTRVDGWLYFILYNICITGCTTSTTDIPDVFCYR